ncbi:MAG TPA: hypothetical protein DCW68_06415 [Rhodospirillaceae bacterium]|nr:hypothetical protein [Rhodospirillaceae bacterium]
MLVRYQTALRSDLCAIPEKTSSPFTAGGTINTSPKKMQQGISVQAGQAASLAETIVFAYHAGILLEKPW